MGQTKRMEQLGIAWPSAPWVKKKSSFPLPSEAKSIADVHTKRQPLRCLFRVLDLNSPCELVMTFNLNEKY